MIEDIGVTMAIDKSETTVSGRADVEWMVNNDGLSIRVVVLPYSDDESPYAFGPDEIGQLMGINGMKAADVTLEAIVRDTRWTKHIDDFVVIASSRVVGEEIRWKVTLVADAYPEVSFWLDALLGAYKAIQLIEGV